MHASSFENMEKCYRRYIANTALERRQQLKVLDVGGADVNGSYADIFDRRQTDYLGADLHAGEGVSVILDDPNKIPLGDSSVDIVLSGQMLEHCEFFWLTFAEMVRVVKDDGYIFLIAPSAGPIHQYPVDCYRFYPDAYRALARYTGCHLVDVWHDNRGPWNDLVGIFNKSGKVAHQDGPANLAIIQKANDVDRIGATAFEHTQGEVNYLRILETLQNKLAPRNYLEIGVRRGRSLRLAQCTAVGVEPMLELEAELPASARVVQQTSDDFFEADEDPILKTKPELVFIDGMHLIEYVLRDFMHVEKICGENTIVVIDDIFPNQPEQASRERETRVWTGDVWKLYPLLSKYRPDLVLIPLDTSPTGLLLIAGLNPNDQTLWQRYNPVIREAQFGMSKPGQKILGRQGAISPTGQAFRQCLEVLQSARQNRTAVRKLSDKLRNILTAGAN